MKLTTTKFATVALLAIVSTSAMAVPVAAISMRALTGSFDLRGLPGQPGAWNFSAATTELIGAQNTEFGDSFTFLWAPVFTFVSDGTYAPYGGGPVPTSGNLTNPISAMLDADAGTIVVDLSSWTIQCGGHNIYQGTAAATGDWNPVNGTYSIAWSSTVVGGPFDGELGNWTLQGVAAVPEASTYGMMLAGLGLVGVLVRLRKQA